ncbi:MADF domain-containing protein [Trichonephila clavata]|uniref:MADF domain-containing protein n=1 Tax=Trichonephila clavata TaxID=2740835 RepID=A0A8X6LWJ9_TRICU|nr:MADF domain-containing protein [Trichonephila clavata]
MRENAWKEIGVSLGLSGDVCKIRFKVLRDRYRKEKVRAFPSGSEAKARKIWPFSEMLSFLDPYMQKGSTWSNITGTTTMPIIVPCIEERIQFEEETGIVQEAEIVQGEDSFNLPETSQPTPITSRRQTPNSKKRKRAREELIDAALMKIGGKTDPEDHLFEFCSKSIKKYPAEAKNEALESIANYVFQMNKKYLQ